MLKYRKLMYLLPWLIVVIWMLLIFNLSAQPAQNSDKLSIGVTEKVVETVEKVTPETELNLDSLNHIVRKNAHFFIYLVLAIWVQIALGVNRVIGFKRLLIVIGICVLYAISDEYHQLFVAGRGAQVKDIFIDSAGVIVGIVIYGIVNRFSSKKSVKPL
ncbi:VanZ family protein [Bacillus sp. ISL-40]|uniref:VanZ family protein n=1 Tax=unclassified Bacillus (in: firmicutes) TaxID=185979 RepID=UPI001BE64792|nr:MULTISPECIES: VanZ family protein [unclassified Bacillus (in: firmicutes)]MBT2695920.1 VanZ family protein [Bacillus sp. ISL-40]MBT2739724.1 VanZ family protein [Bacillus sp. ISL-77]